MNDQRENGFSLLATVMILLVIGVLIMTALQKQLSQQLRITQDERIYIKANSRAISALEWGIHRQWHQPTEVWQCEKEPTYSWVACIKTLNETGDVLVKGESLIEGINVPVMLYQVASIDENRSSENDVVLQKSPVGWLDFCDVHGCTNVAG